MFYHSSRKIRHMLNTMIKSNSGEEEFIWGYRSQPVLGEAGQELEAGTKTAPWLAQLAFLHSLWPFFWWRHSPWFETCCINEWSRKCPTHAHRPVWRGHFLSCGSLLFPDVWSWQLKLTVTDCKVGVFSKLQHAVTIQKPRLLHQQRRGIELKSTLAHA